MPIVRGQWAETLAGGLLMNTFNRYREKAELYRLINNVQPLTTAWYEDFQWSGLGPMVEKGELERTILDEPIKLGGLRIIPKSFALGFLISEEMREDSQFNLMAELSGELGRSSRYTAELWGHDVWNNAFTTTRYVGRDGKALCAVDHPIVGTGGVGANRPAVDVDLSQAALEAAWGNFQTQVDDRGIPIDIMPQTLLVYPTQMLFASTLLKSPGVSSAPHSGIINPIQGWVQPFGDPYLIDQDAWFLNGPPNELPVMFFWKKLPDTKTWDDDDADGTIHKIKQRHAVGFRNWRGVYGSQGG